MFIYIKCKCGRTLRADRSEVEAQIRCWDCREMVRVPRHRSSGRGLPRRLRAALYSTTFETIAGCIVAALVVALVLLLPVVGKYTALALLSVFATLYPARIRQESEGVGVNEARPLVPGARGRFLAWAAKWGWAVLLAVGCVGPLWWGLEGPLRATVPGSRRWIPVALLALALWTVIPFVTYLFEATDEQDRRLGPRRAFEAAARRSRATVAALLAFPLAMIATEVVLVGVLSLPGVFSPWVLDLFRSAHGVDRSELYANLPSRLGPGLSRAARSVYLEELGRGSTLMAAIPLSLERWTRVHYVMETKVPVASWRRVLLDPTAYLVMRLAATTFIIAVGMVVLAAQAFWLSVIARSGSPAPVAPTEELTRAVPG
jgi:hypothetical protein